MKLQVPFVQLPICFDPDLLAAEVQALGEEPWRAHPRGYPGNSAATLITTGGDPESDALGGQMLPTPWLLRCPYMMQVLAEVGGTWGRTRLMRLSGQSEVTPHVDINYYWREHMRVHVPIVTQPTVAFYCGDDSVHMAAGECWIFDTWRNHRVVNDAERPRIHLVADTVGGDRFWHLLSGGRSPRNERKGWQARMFGPKPGVAADIDYESINVPKVMTPWELKEHLVFLIGDLWPDPLQPLFEALSVNLTRRWHALWACYGESPDGRARYQEVLDDFVRQLPRFSKLYLRNGALLNSALDAIVIGSALGDKTGNAGEEVRNLSGTKASPEVKDKAPTFAPPPRGVRQVDPIFNRPVFILSPPRSGSTLLFETLVQASGLYSIGGESHQIIEGMPQLHPAGRNFDSNALSEADATPEISAILRKNFFDALRDRDGRPAGSRPVRIIEKTPKNTLRISFLNKVFPEAQFIYLYRDPRQVISSMIEAWGVDRFQMYASAGLKWAMVLIPGWRDLVGLPVEQIVARQWAVTTESVLDSLEPLPPERWCALRYEDFLAAPQAETSRICAWADWTWDRSLGAELPPSRYTLSAPEPRKWEKNIARIDEVRHLFEAQQQRAEAVVRRRLG